MNKNHLYRVNFINQDKIYEVYTKEVSQGGLFGFVEIGELIFGETSSLVVDPSEEKLRNEFLGVASSFVPMNAIIRIDVVDKEGLGKIKDLPNNAQGNVSPFPNTFIKPGE